MEFKSAQILRWLLVCSISNPHDSASWDRMAAIKSSIFRKWDAASGGIRICCIKFVQRVVQVQTPGVIADPRVCDSRAKKQKLLKTDYHLAIRPERSVAGISASRPSINTSIQTRARSAWAFGQIAQCLSRGNKVRPKNVDMSDFS